MDGDRPGRGDAGAFRQDSSFASTPALAQISISKLSILKLFDRLNTQADPRTGKRTALPYTRQVKPFNFMLIAFPDTGDITTGGEAYWDRDKAGWPCSRS